MKRLLNSRSVDERINAEQSIHKINIPFNIVWRYCHNERMDP